MSQFEHRSISTREVDTRPPLPRRDGRSSASNNGGDGIFVGSGSTVTDNTAYDNTGDGIQAGTDSLAHRNTSRLNGGYGFQLSGGTGYRENVVNHNPGGTVLSGVNLSNNLCNGNTICR